MLDRQQRHDTHAAPTMTRSGAQRIATFNFMDQRIRKDKLCNHSIRTKRVRFRCDAMVHRHFTAESQNAHTDRADGLTLAALRCREVAASDLSNPLHEPSDRLRFATRIAPLMWPDLSKWSHLEAFSFSVRSNVRRCLWACSLSHGVKRCGRRLPFQIGFDLTARCCVFCSNVSGVPPAFA